MLDNGVAAPTSLQFAQPVGVNTECRFFGVPFIVSSHFVDP
jgi:hypothetical protein